ncbi:NAD-dependent epimerase/dehydratase family protein [Sphaerisporangium aureirubrum]|uniref:NAD-dependent epimerase/dehydratase family protein n=1 Tax=Sphaerisporangium aureirubrum TaxID=1544736 RepID=A0ABW1NGS6_9ACTN
MKLLVLGGTEFVGRAVVEAATARGWDVTVLNRGSKAVPEGVTALRGDRKAPGGLDALGGGEWDAVVDTWSWAPRVVRDSARALAGRAGSYIYISSRSVYTYPMARGANEDWPVVEASPDDGDDVEYPRAKAGGELAAVESFGDRAVLVRAGLILGPYENIGRLPWWLTRIAKGGPVLAPGPADLPIQFVDARDLAEWSLTAAERGLSGPYDMISPPEHATMRQILEECVRVTGSDADLRWLPPEPILAAGVEPWTDLPIWLAPGEVHDAFHMSDVSKVIAAGLHCRPVAETIEDTWTWLQSIGGKAPLRPDRPSVGLDPAVEAELLNG